MTVAVNGTHQMPNCNFNGDTLVSFPRFFTNDGIKDDPIQNTGTIRNQQMERTVSTRKFRLGLILDALLHAGHINKQQYQKLVKKYFPL